MLSSLKPYIRWVVFGGTLVFLAMTLVRHWREVATLHLEARAGWFILAALGITLVAHVWAGWVWAWILQELNQAASGWWGVHVYLRTNIAKYLPGNVWHFYGRVVAAKTAGFPLGAATLSVLLEPLLMAAAALAIALIGTVQGEDLTQLLWFVVILLALHPRCLNLLVQVAARLKQKGQNPSPEPSALPAREQPRYIIRRYPWRPLLGELGFVGLRSSGFLLTLLVFQMVSVEQILPVFRAFSVAWLLGLVIPGAPGGIGVFEATAIALLSPQFPTPILLGTVALYRLISTLAEAIGAGWVLMMPSSSEIL